MGTEITNNPSAEIFLARQPILDKDEGLFAYELLYRHARTGFAQIDDENFATTKLINNTFVEIGIDRISENKPVFINLPRAFLTGEIPLPMSPNNVVLEVLEDIVADETTLSGLKKLSEMGFSIALDDFILNENSAEFIQFADYIKVDIFNKPAEELADEVAALKKYDVTLLAEKVETLEEYQHCLDLGFSLFQGYYFCKPKLIEARELPTSQTTLLTIIAKLQSPDIDIEEVETIISQDVSISYKLLRVINSSLYNFSKNIDSLQHALVILGMHALKQWLTLLSLTAIDNKPPELIAHTLRRAKMCEEMSKSLEIRADAAFTIGMFSLLDGLMDTLLEDIITPLPFSEDIKLAILKEEGELGHLLSAVKSYEQGKWEDIDNRYLRNDMMQTAFQNALEWQQKISEELASFR